MFCLCAPCRLPTQQPKSKRQTQSQSGGDSKGSGESGKVRKINTLATITQEIVKALLEKSCMKHLKGASRDHCAMGHKLELPIALDWVNDIYKKK